MAEAKVLQVPEGSIIVLTDVRFHEDAYDEQMETLTASIGHDRWCVLHVTSGADVEVWGPDTDVAERLRALLDK